MLDFIRGDVHAVTDEAAVIAVGGVGIRVEMPTPDLAGLRVTIAASRTAPHISHRRKNGTSSSRIARRSRPSASAQSNSS